MLASEKEIESFAFKFKQLLRSGLHSDLQLKCNTGQALIHLQVRLGYVINSSSKSSEDKQSFSPSKLRDS